jgi:glycerophosphoryl diester phosphodiesterase
MLNIAHRGASGHEPENTLSSFQKAIDLNANMIEFDVRCSKDGELVVIHDETVDRTTNGRGKVRNKELGAIKLLNAGGGQQVPTLHEAMSFIGNRCLVNIELVEYGTATLLKEALQPFYYMRDSIVISSFLFRELKRLHYYMPNINVSYLADTLTVHNIKEISQLTIYSLNINKDLVDEDLVKWLHALAFRVFVFTINTEEDFQRMKSLEIDGIFTDYPDIFHK